MAADVRKKLELYDVIVGYGIGQNYERLKEMMKSKVDFDYLADKKWEDTTIQEYDGIPVIRFQQLKKLKNVLVVLIPQSAPVRKMIMREIEGTGFEVCKISDLVAFEHCINSSDLIKLFPLGEYEDDFHNRVIFDRSISSNIKIHFWGNNNFLEIGKDVSINCLEIYFGNDGNCVIGNATSIEKAELHVSDASLNIGRDCMFSKNVMIRTHDNHHIFDRNTGNRINYAKDVTIKDRVWVGYGASILPGAKIGTGSIVGERAVTSSVFGDHVIIAGCPARPIRENICWSRDNTFFFNRDTLNECIDKNSLKYPDEEIYIAGAHSRGQTLANYLLYLFPKTRVKAYLYDNDEKNPSQIGDIPVIFITDEAALNTELPVYIGTRGVHHRKIAEHLKQLGFERIYPVTADMDSWFRNKYLAKYFQDNGREFLKIDHIHNLEKSKQGAVYVVKSIFDKPLQEKYSLASYEKEILAGAAMAKNILADDVLRDDIGDNISAQNRQFCELTAMYWIWKHAEEEVVGLAHYRRHFILPGDWEERMDNGRIDVILPVPLYVMPNLAENYKSRHDPSDWEYMMGVLKSQDESLYNDAVDFFGGNLYSPCNMFIMRKNVLDELCKWLFPILDAVVKHGGQKEDTYQNRYPGFLSERLITLFFERNRNRYKVVYADKNFLQ